MAKKKSNFLYYVFIILSILFAGIGLAAIALPAFEAKYSASLGILGNYTLIAQANLFSFIFGKGELTYTLNNGDPLTTTLDGGMSYLALAASIALVISLLLLIVLLFKKSKGLALIAGLLLIASGVCIFFFKEFGTNITVSFGEYLKIEDKPFVDFWKMFGSDNVKYGVGTIVFGVGACLSGLTTLIAAIVKR